MSARLKAAAKTLSPVIQLSVHRLAKARGFRFAKPSKLLRKKLLYSDLTIGSPADSGEMLVGDGLPLHPLGDPPLSDPNLSSKLVLTANNLHGSLNSAHGDDISGGYDDGQYRRYLGGHDPCISVVNMGAGADRKKAKPTEADLRAAERLRAIHERTPPKDRPTQQQVADRLNVSQAAVSHYFKGRMRITFNAAVVFADLYHCHPEDIRDDLPEMEAAKAYLASNPPSENADERELDAIWSTYSIEKKKTLLGMERLAAQLSKTDAAGNRTVKISNRYNTPKRQRG